jgi:erythromycin esterase-like protein/predicted phosphoribosyltransferase
MSDRLFRDRRDAGRILARLLSGYRGGPDVVVAAIPPGGVPVGFEIAAALRAPLDIVLTRALGAPGHHEPALGAIGPGGVVVLNEDVTRGLRVASEEIERIAEREGRELARSVRRFAADRPGADLRDRMVIVVDDGLAAGARMRAAVLAVRRHGPARIVVALPAAPESTRRELDEMVDEVVCATTPAPFTAVGASYWELGPIADKEVRALLRAAAGVPPTGVAAAAGAATAARAGPNARAEAAVVAGEALPVAEDGPPDDVLRALVGDARFVLVGEASNGTHEFSAMRAAVTRRLIARMGFDAVVVAADWTDAYRVNRYVRGKGHDPTPEHALRGFEGFPSWTWRNAVVLDFVGWLRQHNDHASATDGVAAGFYGLDLYGLYRTAHEIIAALEAIDPEAAERARHHFARFDHASGGDGLEYGLAPGFGAGEGGEREIVERLVDRHRPNAPRASALARRDGRDPDEILQADLHARLVRTSPRFYRSMFAGRVPAWNLRDQHMVETLEALDRDLTRRAGRPARIVVWAHNAHAGDAGSTELAGQGERNLGQLLRRRHAGDCRLFGFTTHTGSVTAAEDWAGPALRRWLRPALPDSVEGLLHQTGREEFLLAFTRPSPGTEALRSALLERGVGVVYRPQSERPSHYFRARLADQFDAIIHIDRTRAVEPLERGADWDVGELPPP